MIKKLTINGNDFTDSLEGRDFVIVYELDEKTRALSLGTTNELSFYGEGYDWLRNYFFNDLRTDFYKTAEVKVTVECCVDREYTFIIDAEGLTICPDDGVAGCSIRAVLRTNEDVDREYRKLSQRIFWKGNNLTSRIFNKSYFALLNIIYSMDLTQYIVYYLYRATIVITLPLTLIADLFGPNNAINRLEDWLVGAGKFQIAFNVAKAIEWNTNLANINFISPALQTDPYKNMYWLEARYDNGIDQRWKNDITKVNQLWENNGANKTVIDLLNDLKPVFNYDFRLIGNDLIFDTRENIIARLDTLFDLDEIVRENGLNICYKYQQLKAYAFGRFEYTNDQSEAEGNKASAIYNDIVDWNTNPTNDFQRDELSNIIQFAPVRFQNDTLQDKYDIEEIWFQVERARRGSFFGRKHENEVYLTRGYSYLPKLIILDSNNTPKRRFLRNWRTFIGGNIPMYEYNTDMYFDAERTDNLYDRFHYTQNPRTRVGDVIEADTIEIPLSCEYVDKIEQNRMNLKIDTQFGPGIFDKVEINFGTQTIKIDGLKI